LAFFSRQPSGSRGCSWRSLLASTVEDRKALQLLLSQPVRGCRTTGMGIAGHLAGEVFNCCGSDVLPQTQSLKQSPWPDRQH
jgi:hypothetical protein